MKKILSLIFITICILIIIPSRVYAFDISVGATIWYAYWDIDIDRELGSGESYERDIDPAFLYGPAISMKFNNDFNLTFVYLFGKFDFEDKVVNTMDQKKDGTKKRSDGDLALNYRLTDYFKIFAGIKYMAYEYKTNETMGAMSFDYHIEHSSYGPGAGLSCTFPVTENLFILATLSGFYLWGDHKESIDQNMGIGSIYDYKFDYIEYGINSNISIAYYIAPASIVISLGGRFQYFKTEFDETITIDNMGQPSNSNAKNKFYGVTLTATYTFSF